VTSIPSEHVTVVAGKSGMLGARHEPSLMAQRLWLLRVLAILTVPIEIGARYLGAPAVLASVRGDFFTQGAIASLLVLYLINEHAWRRRRKVIASVAVVFLTILVMVQTRIIGRESAVHIGLLELGVIGLFHFAYAAAQDAGLRAAWRRDLPGALTVVLGVALTPFFLWMSFRINPVQDLYVLAFEDSLGIRPSVLGVRLFDAFPRFGLLCTLCYVALPLGIVALQALQRPERTENDIVVAFVSTAAIGYALYSVFPVVGPMTAFGAAYPQHLPAIGTVHGAEIIAPTNAPRNGLPSLHAAWAMLIWINARGLDPTARRVLRIFATANLFATMGVSDTHWLTDLVVSLPLTIGIQALCNVRLPFASRTRWRIVLACASLFVAWLILLWWGQPAFASAPVVAWLAIAGTVAACWMMSRGVARSAGAEPRRRTSPIGRCSWRCTRRACGASSSATCRFATSTAAGC
jgi:hypothetical protein